MTSAKAESNPQIGLHWYESIADFSPVGLFFTDADGNCLHVNNRWCEIAGMTLEEALGRGWLKAIHNEDFELVDKLWYESAQKEKPFHAEYRFCTPLGITTWVVGDARAILKDDGTIEGYVGTITDISKIKEQMDQLKRSESRIRTIITQMPVMLFALDKAGNLCAWNKESERVTGYMASELIGNSKAMKLLFSNPEYRQTMTDVFKPQRNHDFKKEWKLTTKEGEIKRINFSNISKHQQVEGWENWGIGVDVTSCRNVEDELKERVKELNCLYKLSVLSNQPNLDLDMFLSEAVKLLPLSLTYPESSCARIVYEDKIFQTDLFKVTQWSLCSRFHVRGHEVGLVEVYYIDQRPAAGEGPFLFEERMLVDEISLQISRTVGHVLSRKDLALLDELSAKAEELEQFSHTVSHDLKTPLAAIGGFADLLDTQLSKGDFSQVKYCSERIINITKRMEQRLDDLLKLAKLGKIIEPTEEIPFKSIIDETVSLMEQRFANKNISVKIASSFPTVLGDRARLLEVVEILMDNAAKYIGEPPNQISVGLRGEGSETVFMIQDNGIGLDANQFDAIFELFRRLDRSIEGDGAGLAIAKRIINAHGGQLWVESDGEGKGSCFCFTFGYVLNDLP